MIVESDVPAKMRDGVILRADIYRPGADEDYPVLLTRTPYDKSAVENFHYLDPREAVARGYAVVIQDVRGRGKSEGAWLPWTHETRDGFDSVQWASQLHCSNGEVFMWGGSYVGHAQWRAAVAHPPALRAIAPAVTWSNPREGLLLRGGVPEHGLNTTWTLITGVEELAKRDGMHSDIVASVIQTYDALPHGGYAALPDSRVPLVEPHGIPDIGYRRFVDDPSMADQCDVASVISSISVPALNIGGWYDAFAQGTLDNFTDRRESSPASRLVMGPWTHANDMPSLCGDLDFGMAVDRRPSINVSRTGQQLDFFDAQRADIGEHSVDAPVQIFVMGINTWREEDEWPLRRAVQTDLFLRSDSTLTFEPPSIREDPSSFTFDARNPAPTVGGATVLHAEFRAGGVEQSSVESRDDVLVYTTSPLEDDLEVTGRVTAVVYGTSTAASTDWVVRLCDVDENGRSFNLVDGVLRTHASDGPHEVDLWSTSNVFKAGHRIRVQVTCSNFPRWSVNPDLVSDPDRPRPSMSVFHEPARLSRISIPVVPAEQPES